jgi:hypothetical protein
VTIRYARGSRAWGMCARSNRKMLLNDMVRDPLTDLLVDPDWAEPPLMRPPTDITDGVALEHPAPDLDRIGTQIVVGAIFDISTGEPFRPLYAKYEMSPPTIQATLRYLATEDGTFIITEDGQYIALEQYLVTEGGEFLVTEDGTPIQL